MQMYFMLGGFVSCGSEKPLSLHAVIIPAPCMDHAGEFPAECTNPLALASVLSRGS